jgi:hypothetical protein
VVAGRSPEEASNFTLFAAGIVAAPFLCHPRRMLADPLGDIGLRSHHALTERTIPGELKIFFLAIIGIGDGTDGQDDFNQSVLHSKLASTILRQIYPRVSNFDRNHAVSPIRNRYILAVTTPAQETSGTSTVELGTSPNIHRPAQTICRIATSREQETSIERRMKSAALTLNVIVQCFKNSGKLGRV